MNMRNMVMVGMSLNLNCNFYLHIQYEIYNNFYNENINKINMNYPYIQFLANMAVYQQNNK